MGHVAKSVFWTQLKQPGFRFNKIVRQTIKSHRLKIVKIKLQ